MSDRRSEADLGFTRVAIVNGGEAAARLTRAVRELNLEHGWGMRTMAWHAEVERRALFVSQADVRSSGEFTDARFALAPRPPE